jgi:uncharacterized protein (DUF58 family)
MGKKWWLLIGLMALLGAVLRHELLLLVALLLALVAGASHLWARYCLAGVSYRRRFSATRLFYGQTTELSLEIVNAKPLPLAWFIAVDEMPAVFTMLTETVYRSPTPHRRLFVLSLSLRWYERVTRRYQLQSNRRGVWTFGPAQISSGDIFGFSVRREALADMQTIVVYPKIVPLTALGMPDLRPFGDYKTPRRLVADPLRLMGARDYAPGDSFRHIHWKASAHQRTLQTKLFEPSAAYSLAIFLDVRTSIYANEGIDRDLLELAVTTAASIAHWGWERGLPVGLYVNSMIRPHHEPVRIRPGYHPDQLAHILEALARLEETGPWTMARVLEVEAATLAYGTTAVVITSLIDDRLRRALLDLRRGEHGVALATLGDKAPVIQLPGVRHYHIGGGEVWHELATLELA